MTKRPSKIHDRNTRGFIADELKFIADEFKFLGDEFKQVAVINIFDS